MNCKFIDGNFYYQLPIINYQLPITNYSLLIKSAGMVELADTLDLGSRFGGSNPSSRTEYE